MDTSTKSTLLIDTSLIGPEQQRRRARLKTIIDKGLPPFPHTALELSSMLGKATLDLKKAGKVIRADPSLSAQVLRICNSPMFGLRTRVLSIEQATVLIGADRLRSLAMTCSLVNYSEKGLPKDQAASFWRHSLLAALLCQHMAKESEYSENEQAYIAGLLHDIGQLPQWMLAVEEKRERKTETPSDWPDNAPLERLYFGMDHCEIGSCMAVNWNLMPSFVDVLSHHHEPSEASHDPRLVEIIATVEDFLLAKEKSPTTLKPQGSGEQQLLSTMEELNARTQSHGDAPPGPVSETLNREYERLLPILEQGLLNAIGAG